MAKNKIAKITDSISTSLLILGGLIMGFTGLINFDLDYNTFFPTLLSSFWILVGISAIWNIFRKIR